MRQIFSGAILSVTVFFAISCSQSDQQKARVDAERAKERTKQEARRLASKTKEAASEISDKTKLALNDSDGTTATAEAKLRRGAGELRAAGKNASTEIAEGTITAKVKSQIAADAGLSAATAVHVTTSGHTVTLTGNVASEEKRREVEKAALAVDGVTKVQNRLAVP